MQVTIPQGFEPREYQLKVFQALDGIQGRPETKIKRILLRWPRRAGKDKTCWCYTIKEAARQKGNYFYIFPEATEGRKALWENIDSKGMSLMDHIPKQLIKSVNSVDMSIKLTNGSTIRVVGVNKNIHAIRGISAKGIVFSEFAYQDPEAHKVLGPVINESEGWVIYNSTPDGRNHMYELENANVENPEWFVSVIQTLWPDRPCYYELPKCSPAELESFQQENMYTDDDMEREFGVSYETGRKGSIYLDCMDKAREEGRVGMFPYDSNYPVSTFWDLGYNDPTAIWFVQYRGAAVVFIDYWEKEQMDIPDIVKVLENKGYNYDVHYLPHDAGSNHQLMYSKKQLLENVLEGSDSRAIVEVLPKPKSVHERINATRARFRSYFFNRPLTYQGIDTLELYHKRFDKQKQIFTREPVHDWTSHCADALGAEPAANRDGSARYNNTGDELQIVSDFNVYGDDDEVNVQRPKGPRIYK